MKKDYFLHITNKYLTGTISPDEEKELLEAIEASQEHKLLFKKETEKWIPPAIDTAYDEKWKRIVSVIGPQKRPDVKHYSISSYLKIAAVFILLVAGGLTAYRLNFFSEKTDEQVMISMTAETDDEIFLLPDSTSVYLRKGSNIAYFATNSVEERIVQLEGEAFFEVTTDPEKPFFVQTEGLTVKVTGTSFSVNTYNKKEHISVILVEGEVCLFTGNNEVLGTLHPNQQADFSLHNNSCQITEVDSNRLTLWRKGIIAYENATLQEIIELLNHHFHKQFTVSVASPDETEYFSGAFLKTQPMEMVIEQIEKLTDSKIILMDD